MAELAWGSVQRQLGQENERKENGKRKEMEIIEEGTRFENENGRKLAAVKRKTIY